MDLSLPCPACEASYQQAIEGYARAGLSPSFFFGGAETCPAGLFPRFEDCRAGRDLPAGYVPCTSLWLVDGNEFLAEVSIRHRLTPALERFAGHIGYAVRADRWGQGLGTRLLAGALDYARETLGLSWVLLTCADGNTGSARVIEKNGGVLLDKLDDVIDGKPRVTRRYRIEL